MYILNDNLSLDKAIEMVKAIRKTNHIAVVNIIYKHNDIIKPVSILAKGSYFYNSTERSPYTKIPENIQKAKSFAVISKNTNVNATTFNIANVNVNKTINSGCKYIVEKNVPLPNSKVQYPFELMNKGDSFFIPTTDCKVSQVSILNMARKNNIKVTTKKYNDGIRVWKV